MRTLLVLVLTTTALAAPIETAPPTIMGAYVLGAVAGCGKTITRDEANALAAKAALKCRADKKDWMTCAHEVAEARCAQP